MPGPTSVWVTSEACVGMTNTLGRLQAIMRTNLLVAAR
jgi:hypothetical protein